jgi:CBS domain-containing protein
MRSQVHSRLKLIFERLTVTTIRQVMNSKVAAIRTDMSVAETIEFLTINHIGGAPVISVDGQLVGMISELALIDVVFDETVKFALATRFMTVEVQSVGPDDPLSRAAQLFALYAFRRLPVVENGKLVGIITRRDLMNFALSSGNVLVDPLVDLIPSLAASP